MSEVVAAAVAVAHEHEGLAHLIHAALAANQDCIVADQGVVQALAQVTSQQASCVVVAVAAKAAAGYAVGTGSDQAVDD